MLSGGTEEKRETPVSDLRVKICNSDIPNLKQEYYSVVRDLWFCEYRTTNVTNRDDRKIKKKMIWVSLLLGHDATSLSNRFQTSQGTGYLVTQCHIPH